MKYRIILDGKVVHEQDERIHQDVLRTYLSEHRLGDTYYDSETYDYILYTPIKERGP